VPRTRSTQIDHHGRRAPRAVGRADRTEHVVEIERVRERHVLHRPAAQAGLVGDLDLGQDLLLVAARGKGIDELHHQRL